MNSSSPIQSNRVLTEYQDKLQNYKQLCTMNLKKFERRKARISQGMSPEPDFKERVIGLIYDPMPKIKTRDELRTSRKLNNYSLDYNILNTRHDSPEVRLFKREEQYRVASSDGLTLEKLLQKRKNENIEYHTKIFGNVRTGIHKSELPKFSKYKKVYLNRYEMKEEDLTNNTVKAKEAKRAESSFEKELTKKVNETIPSPKDFDVSYKYGKKFIISKLQSVVHKYFKNYEELEDILSYSRRNKSSVKDKLSKRFDRSFTPQFQVKHIRSSGFNDTHLKMCGLIK